VTEKPVRLYVDGSSLGNPGHGGCGYLIVDAKGNVIDEGAAYLGIVTNNEAEYHGLLLGLKALRKLGVKEVEILTDSRLLYMQLIGKYRVKAENLRPLHREVRELLKGFRWNVRWVQRNFNKRADQLAKRAARGGIGNGEVHS